MWFKRFLVLILVALFFVSAQNSFAEGEDAGKNNEFNLGQVVVTATRTERQVKDVSASVSVITSEEIKNSNAKSIPEILNKIPGMYVYHEYGTPVEGKMSLRGFSPYGSERVLVMVNGVPWNSGNDNYVQFAKLPAIEDVESIEIVKGPTSALYGGCAMGGAINIITKKGERKASFDNTFEFGDFGERNYRTEASGTQGKMNYRLAGGYRGGDGYRNNTEYTRRTLAGNIGLDLKKAGELSFDFDAQNTHTGYASGLTEAQYKQEPKLASSPSAGYLDSHRFALHYKNSINEEHSLKSFLYLTKYEYDYPASTRYAADINAFGGEIQYNIDSPLFGKKNSFVTGVSLKYDYDIDYKQYTGTTLDIYDHPQVRFWGLFFQEEITPLEMLTFTLGGRFDWADYEMHRFKHNTSAERSFDKFSPKFGALYRLTKDINLFGNIGRAFNPPSSHRLFTSGYANPDLGPEEATNYELGLKGVFFDKLSLNLSGYFMDVEDEIASERIGTVTRYYNTGKTEHKGIELESMLWLTSRLNTFFNANFQEAKFKEYKSGTAVYDGRWISHVPKRTFAFGLNYEHPFGITYNISGNYRSDSYADDANSYVIPSRIIWDTRLDFKRQFKGINFGIYGGIRNLFDRKYFEYMSSAGKIYPAYPRNFIVGFKIGKDF